MMMTDVSNCHSRVGLEKRQREYIMSANECMYMTRERYEEIDMQRERESGRARERGGER